MAECVSDLRVLIFAEHASAKFGGEAILPLHYFRLLRRRGIETWLIVHERTKAELLDLFGEDAHRITFIPDTKVHIWIASVAARLPRRLSNSTLGILSRLLTQVAGRKIARRMITEHGIGVVHQPIPVSPKEPSVFHAMGVPVIIGPMNGGMNYPPAYRRMEPPYVGIMVSAMRSLSGLANRIIPGKREAAILLVANERTRAALPAGVKGRVVTLVENGVDVPLWSGDPPAPTGQVDGLSIPRFAFVGRLVNWKCVDVLLSAFRLVVCERPAVLDIYGDGAMRGGLERMSQELGLRDRVAFHGWIDQGECARRLRSACALVLPSVYECGGAVVLEAMAVGLPVIATRWGGPADYVDQATGILVDPGPRDEFVAALAAAMLRLLAWPSLRDEMGRAARSKVLQHYDWEKKIDTMLNLYEQVRVNGRRS